MIQVIDNFFDQSVCEEITSRLYAKANLNSRFKFVRKTLIECESSNLFSDICISLAKNFFSLESMVGYEIWYNIDNKPSTWHLDKDETLNMKHKIMRYPFCSIIFYPFVNCAGGRFLFKENINDDAFHTIEIKTNRILLVPPGILHNVEEFKGNRISIVICPWDYEVEPWIQNDLNQKY